MKQDFMNYIKESTTAYQAVAETAKRLEAVGYDRIYEEDDWKFSAGDKKYVVRNDSSLIAFCIPQGMDTDSEMQQLTGFHFVCAHSDSPSFKLKENPCIAVENSYLKLNVENYGGMMKESWLDRPLSVAGRLVVRTEGIQLETKLVDMKRPLFIMPSLAVHMKRGGEKDGELNTQIHLLPLAGTKIDKDALGKMLAKETGVKEKDIFGTDLYLYPVAEPVCMGLNGELLGAPRLDDLACVYCGLQALISGDSKDKVSVLAVFDNEEVGSQTMQGAASDFLLSVLRRIAGAFGQDTDRLLSTSFLISADNAHAIHPNYTEKADPTNRPVLNKGIVIKYHGGQKYTTSAYSGALVKAICEEEKIPYQTYHNRSDVAGGSTLGNIALTSVSVPAADIGIAQLAMHSAFETMGAEDLGYMISFMKAFYEAKTDCR